MASPPISGLRKVPEITALFWLVKVLTTGMGETTSDFLVHQLGPIPAVALGAVAFVAALWRQLSIPRYDAWIYWLAVVMVAVFGTMCADALHIELGVPYVVSTGFFSISLAAVFAVWYRCEGTLSIHTIDTRRRELFYWLTVVTTFALGTAMGDMTARTLHLGYLASGVVFAAIIAIPAVGYRWFGLERGRRVLVRLRRDAAARRVDRRLGRRPASARRPRRRLRAGQHRAHGADRGVRGLPEHVALAHRLRAGLDAGLGGEWPGELTCFSSPRS